MQDMAIRYENFVVVRPLLPRTTAVRPSRTAVAPPTSADDLTYQELLSEANTSFFQREFSVALDAYQNLREKILIESHPELPPTPGISVILGDAVRSVDPGRLVELSRQVAVSTAPGGALVLNTPTKAVVAPPARPNPALGKFFQLSLDPGRLINGPVGAVGRARQQLVAGAFDAAMTTYQAAADQSTARGDLKAAANLTAERAAMRATYSAGPARPDGLRTASMEFAQAASLYQRLGDDTAAKAVAYNLSTVADELDGGSAVAHPAGAPVMTAPPATTARYLAPVDGRWDAAAVLAAQAPMDGRSIGLYTSGQVQIASLDAAQFQTSVVQLMYQPRITATTLDAIDFYPILPTNFVAYLTHLYFYVLPVCIGDTYRAQGRWGDALVEYRAALAYPYLNLALEAPDLWRRMAGTYLDSGKELFRQQQRGKAKAVFESIVVSNLTVPSTSELYAPAPFNQMQAQVTDAIKATQGQAVASLNPTVATIVTDALLQLTRLGAGQDYFGIGPDTFPIFRFKYLQSVANFLADAAVQAERAYMQFQSTAEQQKLDRIQLEGTVQLNQSALAIEQSRLTEAADEIDIADEAQTYAEDRLTHAQNELNDWNTKGYEASRQDFYLTWAASAGNDTDITFTNALYEGERHDFSMNVSDFISKIASRRATLNFELQQSKLQDQVGETVDELAMAQSRAVEAQHRYQTQALSVTLAQQRLASSQEALQFSNERMFNEDTWFRLAGEMQDLSRYYLDKAIYSALLMQRAYAIEFDRIVTYIRTDYGVGGTEGLLGGDYLKRDIAQFTVDALQYQSKTNPIRHVISLRNEFPAAFAAFQQTGELTFTTALELFDRPFPGTYRRKIKKLEVFVEGLLPAEGATGFIVHSGVCKEWRKAPNGWVKQAWSVPPERMVLSSYQFRRDLSIFTPSEEVLGLFEDYAPQGNWTLTLPPASNDLDYQAITDIQFIVYLTAEYDADLASHVAAVYPATGGRIAVLSARLYYPDEYYRIDVDRKVTFTIDAGRFPHNYSDLALTAFGVTVLDKNGAGIAGAALTVARASDASTVTGATSAKGVLAGDAATMAPFQAWKGASPIDAFTVSFAAGFDTTAVGDIQLVYGYTYALRTTATG
jgi:hypothetical protein